jgi:pimeloyl-ACP methyl ester carboxylesterase
MEHPMSWWEHEKLLNGGPYATSADHLIVYQRESIPIVFVPGIMGSRLKRRNFKVWDPNSTGFMANYLFATPAQRKALLDEKGLEVDTDTSKAFQSTVFDDAMYQEYSGTEKLMGFGLLSPSRQQEILNVADDCAKAAAAQGWGGVAWDFYGGILNFLSRPDLWSPFGKCFVFPVYAVGYNWVQDNLKSGDDLAKRFDVIMNLEKDKGLICEKIILVSHSMGGMVTRSAVKLHGGEGKVLGVIHGAQPVTGAPDAYKSMRAGSGSSWNPKAKVLGAGSRDVVPVLGNSVGAMELLPTTKYVNANWLSMTKDDALLSSKPKGDPYSSTYHYNSEDFLRLIYHPEYLDPGATDPDLQDASTRNRLVKVLVEFMTKVEAARSFHQQLQLQCHPVTYSSWVGDKGLSTMDKIEYRFLQPHFDVPWSAPDPNPVEGSGIDLWENKSKPSENGYYVMQSANGKGDGTVPTSSGAGLSAKSNGIGGKLNRLEITEGLEHTQFYNNGDVQKFTLNCIKELAQKHFKDRMGG